MELNEIVYVLTNPAMPGLVKIGKTTQTDVSLRMNQLYTSGVPVPFECVYAIAVDDCSKVESGGIIGDRPRLNERSYQNTFENRLTRQIQPTSFVGG